MNVSLGSVELLVGKIEMGEDKNQNYIGPLPHNFRVNLHQNSPPKIVVLRPVRVLSWIGLLGWKNFDITFTMAPTPEQSFGDFGNILSNIVK